MKFFSYSLLADQALSKFPQRDSEEMDPCLALLPKKIALCDYEVWLIARDEPILDRLSQSHFNPQEILILYRAWQSLGKESRDMTLQSEVWRVIDHIGEVLLPGIKSGNSILLRRFRDDPAHKRFFLLLTGREKIGLPLYDLLLLCNNWQLERGYLPVHSSGVVHKSGLFLFAGPSGVGKSTVATLSFDVGDTVLDDDQVLVHLVDDNKFLAEAWGYNLGTCDAPLRSIFKLTQDSSDGLMMLTQLQTAHMLMERVFEVLGAFISDDMLKRALSLAASIARNVSGYELHFRKSPDFWKLIDEQFPD